MSIVNFNNTTPAAPGGNTNVTFQKSGDDVSAYVPDSTSPLTTKGDLFGFDSAADRIPVGSDGQVLTADSGAALGVQWQTPATGGIIGVANFDMNTGAISKAHYGGCIASVTYVNTGRITVNLSPNQTNFSVAMTANDPGSLGVLMYMSGTPDFSSATSSFGVDILDYNIGAFIDPNQVCIMIAQL